MSINLKEKLNCFLSKLKGIKHIKIYVAVILALLALGFYYLSLDRQNSSNGNADKIDNSDQNFSTSAEYATFIENKLESVISSLKGVGETEVVITLEKGFEYVYQTEEETKTLSNGTTLTSSSIVLIDGQPLVIQEIYPTVKGIIVIAQGSDNVSTRLDIINLIQTVIEIDTNKINIIQGK